MRVNQKLLAGVVATSLFEAKTSGMAMAIFAVFLAGGGVILSK